MSSPDSSANPLFAHGTPPRFEEIGPEHVHEAMPVLLARTKAALKDFEADIIPNWDGIFERIRLLMDPVQYAWKVTAHLMSVRNSDELRSAHEAFQPAMVELYNTVRQSQPIYDALETLRSGPDWADLGGVRLLHVLCLYVLIRVMSPFFRFQYKCHHYFAAHGRLSYVLA